MQYGDLSNSIPQRVIVTTDVFIMTELEELPRKYKLIKRTRKKVSFKKEVLSQLFLWAVQTPYVLELASFGLNQEELDAVMETMDKYGTNPFRHCVSYESIDTLISQLPYRPELIGVIDRPDRILRYGHWGMDLARL